MAEEYGSDAQARLQEEEARLQEEVRLQEEEARLQEEELLQEEARLQKERECVICYELVETGKKFPCSNSKCTEANTTCRKCGKARFLEMQKQGIQPNCHLCRQSYPVDHLRKHGLEPLPAPATFSRVINGIKYSFYPPGDGSSPFAMDSATFVNGTHGGRPSLQRLPLNEAEIRIEDHDEDHFRVTVIPYGTTWNLTYHFVIRKDDPAIDLLREWQRYLASHKE
jgi:hypothetical protein